MASSRHFVAVATPFWHSGEMLRFFRFFCYAPHSAVTIYISSFSIAIWNVPTRAALFSVFYFGFSKIIFHSAKSLHWAVESPAARKCIFLGFERSMGGQATKTKFQTGANNPWRNGSANKKKYLNKHQPFHALPINVSTKNSVAMKTNLNSCIWEKNSASNFNWQEFLSCKLQFSIAIIIPVSFPLNFLRSHLLKLIYAVWLKLCFSRYDCW